jgi:pimeloyl-ACP methyl ester carboxylesterase
VPFARRDIDIYYADEGDADVAVLFCHGAGGNGTSWWQQVPEFAKRYRCLALDHRGFGRSPCAPGGFSVAEFASDAVAVLDAARVERAHLVCQSMGGWTGVRLTLGHRDRVASLTLCDTIGGLALPSGLDSARTMGERAAAAGAVSPALAADYHRRDPSGAFLYLQLSAFNTGFEQLDLFRRLFAADALVPLERIGELTLPMLVIAGTHDLIWPPAVLRELAGRLPDARFLEVDAGHSAYFENPIAFNAALRTFLDEVAPLTPA